MTPPRTILNLIILAALVVVTGTVDAAGQNEVLMDASVVKSVSILDEDWRQPKSPDPRETFH